MTNPLGSIDLTNLWTKLFLLLHEVWPLLVLPVGFIFGLNLFKFIYKTIVDEQTEAINEEVTQDISEDEFEDWLNEDESDSEEEDEETTPDDQIHPISIVPFCLHCGIKLLENQQYCPGCGAPITKSSYQRIQ